jgi:hypothetical protein
MENLSGEVLPKGMQSAEERNHMETGKFLIFEF